MALTVRLVLDWLSLFWSKAPGKLLVSTTRHVHAPSPWLRSSDVTFTATLPRMLPNMRPRRGTFFRQNFVDGLPWRVVTSVCSARAGFIRSPSSRRRQSCTDMSVAFYSPTIDSSFIPPATPNIPTARRPYAPLPKSSSAAACLRGGSRVLLAHGIRVRPVFWAGFFRAFSSVSIRSQWASKGSGAAATSF